MTMVATGMTAAEIALAAEAAAAAQAAATAAAAAEIGFAGEAASGAMAGAEAAGAGGQAAGTAGANAGAPAMQAATKSMALPPAAPPPAAPPPAAPPPGGILGSGITGSDAMMGAMGANAVSNAMMSPNGDMSNPMEEDRKRRMAASQANVNAFNSNKGMKTGGAVKGFAKGGSIVAKPVERRRGDGIAQRGRTKGRMV